mgnify:FL=1
MSNNNQLTMFELWGDFDEDHAQDQLIAQIFDGWDDDKNIDNERGDRLYIIKGQ